MPTVSITVARARLQARVDADLQADRETIIRGEQELDGPLYIRHPGRVVFDRAVLRPRVIWDPFDAVVVVTGSDVRLEGDLEIDERGYYRTLSNSVGQSILCTNLEDFDFSCLRVRFRDTGVAVALETLEPMRSILEAQYSDTLENLFDEEAGPSGPDLLFVGLDNLDDFYTEGTYLGEIGPCRRGIVGWTDHVRDERTKRSFAIRAATNFAENRAFDDFTNPCEDIMIRQVTIRGSYEWNMVECLGTGTRGIRFGEVVAAGKTLTALDFDKGVSRCHADRVVLVNSGKPDRYVGDGSTRFAAVNIHGSSAGETVDDCSVGEIILRSASSASTDPYESAFACQYASNVRVGTVDAEDLNDGEYGAGVLVDTGVDRVSIGCVRTRGTSGGVAANANSPIGDIEIGDLDIAAEDYGVYLTVNGASGRAQIDRGRVSVTGTLGGGVPIMSFDAELARVSLGPIEIGGGGAGAMGIFTAGPLFLSGTKISTAAIGVQAIGALAKVRAVGVDASTCSTPTSAGSGGSFVGAGNSWQD